MLSVSSTDKRRCNLAKEHAPWPSVLDDLKNAGAQHKGSFSRLKHTYASMAGGSKGNSFRVSASQVVLGQQLHGYIWGNNLRKGDT
eukprot:131818-Pelagomonas_calceolata.AAC.6